MKLLVIMKTTLKLETEELIKDSVAVEKMV